MGIGGIIAGAMGGVGDAMSREAEINMKRDTEIDLAKIREDMGFQKQLRLVQAKARAEAAEKSARVNGALGLETPTAAGAADTGSNQQLNGLPQERANQVDEKLKELSQSFKIPVEALRADLYANDGKGISQLINERQKPNKQLANGVVIDLNKSDGVVSAVHTTADGKSIYVTPGEGGAPNVSVPKGAPEAYGAYQGIQAGVQAATKPIKVFNPETQREEYVPESAVLGLGGKSQPSANKIDPALQLERDRGRLETVGSELNTAKAQLQQAITAGETKKAESLKGLVDALGREYASVEKKTGPSGDSQAVAQAGEPKKGNYAAGPTFQEGAKQQSLVHANENWLKSRFNPALTAGDVAKDVIVNVSIAKDAMSKIGSTGWSTETISSAAKVLDGLGLGTERSRVYAQNATMFNNVAKKQINAVLNEAKGPQTDQDATRAEQTFASLGNVTEANRMILDVAEAKARRDVMKATFYGQMMEHAKQSGDYQSIDREWMKVEPSIFAMPSMKKWSLAK